MFERSCKLLQYCDLSGRREAPPMGLALLRKQFYWKEKETEDFLIYYPLRYSTPLKSGDFAQTIKRIFAPVCNGLLS